MAITEENNSPNFDSLVSEYLLAITNEHETQPWENYNVRHLLFEKIILLGQIKRIRAENRLYWLSCRCDYRLNGKEVSNADFLSAPHKSQWRYRAELTLIVLTFPISVPALMLWSRFTRGVWQFWQTAGSIFVKNVREILNNEHTPPVQGGSTLRTANTLFQEQKLSIYNPELDRDPPVPIGDLSHLRIKFDARPKVIIPFSVGRTGYHYLHEYKLESKISGRPDFPSLMEFRMFHELYNTAPISRPDLFSKVALADLKQENPDIDLNRGMFRYPVIQFFESIPSGGPLERKKEPNPLTVDNLHEILPPEEAAPPSLFQSMLSMFKPAIHDNPDIIFDRLIENQKYMEALRNACNITQIVTALEGLISDAQACFEEQKRRKEELEKYIENHPFDNPRHMEDRRIGVQNLQRYMDEAQEKLHTYISWLPNEYWLHSATIQEIEEKYRLVTRRIYEGNFYEALKIQNRTRCKSGFLIHTAPHLIAWENQLHAILILLRSRIDQASDDASESEWPMEDRYSFTDPAMSLSGLTEKQALICLEKISEILNSANPEIAAYFDEHTLTPVRAMVNERRELRLVAMINYGFEDHLDREDREELRNRQALPGPRR